VKARPGNTHEEREEDSGCEAPETLARAALMQN